MLALNLYSRQLLGGGLVRFYSDYLKRLFSLISLSIMKNPPTTVN